MCQNPRIHPNGLKTPCHQCWQCKENRVNDWVGRCIAEKETALASTVVTLTYGGGDCPESRFLRKSDITTAIKSLRNDGHEVRYFAVGEYGSKKGRAHFHIILFWQTPVPSVEWRKNVHVDWWSHGYTYWDQCDAKAIRYALKYITKDYDDEKALRCMAMSRKPILGAEFFAGLARRYVQNGLSPQRPFYRFRDVLDKQDKPIEFYMPPLVAERFVREFIAAWENERGGHWPTSELVDKYHDKMVGFVPTIYRAPYQRRDKPWMLPPSSPQLFDEKLNSWYCEHEGERLFWSFDERGQRTWQRKIVTEAQAEKLAAQAVASDARKT